MSSRVVRYCPQCVAEMPPDWKKPYCKFCGAMLQVSVESADRRGGGDVWNGEEDLGGWKRKKFVPSERSLGDEGLVSQYEPRDYATEGSLKHLSPFFVLLLSIFTLGISTTFWIAKKAAAADVFLPPESRSSRPRVTMWIVLHLVSVLMLGTIPLEHIGAIPHTDLSQLAIIYWVIAFVTGRSYLLHIRAAIESAINEDRPTNRLVRLAPSPLLLWYVGASYLQMALNRSIGRGELSEEKIARYFQEDD